MENPEEILGSLEEFAKMKPKDIPRELEEYLKYVAKTGDPIYQWAAIKSLFREKFINVITDFYESSVILDIPPCPNVEMFNYELMKGFILEKLDGFAAAPFTLQRICELLTNPKKEYSRIDKYMRALEKNVLVVSTVEPGGRRTENGDSFMNGIESDHEHVPEPSSEINVEEMDESPYVQANNHIAADRLNPSEINNSPHTVEPTTTISEPTTNATCTSTSTTNNEEYVCVQYVAIEPMTSGDSSENAMDEGKAPPTDFCVTIAAVNVKDDDGNEVVMAETVTQLTEAIITRVEENVLQEREVGEVSEAGEGQEGEAVKEASSEAEVAVESSEVKQATPEPDQQPDIHMDTEPTPPSEEPPKPEEPEPMTDSSKEPQISVAPPEDSTPSSTSPEPEKVPEASKIPEPVESESVSPENSISSSDSSSSANITESDETSSSSVSENKVDEVVESVDSTTEESKVSEMGQSDSVEVPESTSDEVVKEPDTTKVALGEGEGNS